MKRDVLYYDLHIHSCLSPCAEKDMTPANIVGMAKLKGLDVIAVTDHNTCLNCAAAIHVGQMAGLSVLPGMELCTREEIHVVCLFRSLEGALAFSEMVYAALPDIANRPEIFGGQIIMDENDRVAGYEKKLLLNATSFSFDEIPALARRFDGVAFPAHADRPSYGVYGVLGAFPLGAGYRAAELSPECDRAAFLKAHHELLGLMLLSNSDAHALWQISEREHCVQLMRLFEREGRF